jgi:hypothetical protein
LGDFLRHLRIDDPMDGRFRVWLRWDKLGPELAWVRERLNDPEMLRGIEQMDELDRRGGPIRYGVTDALLPNGAIAAIVREPSGDARRLMVFSSVNVTPAALLIARLALTEDELAVMDPAPGRVVYVWSDQRFQAPGREGRMGYILHPVSAHLKHLLRARTVSIITVPELGEVRIVDVS